MMSVASLTASQFQHTILKASSPRRGNAKLSSVIVRCEKSSDIEAVNSRRDVLTGLGIGAAAVSVNVQPSVAAYGEPAKIFGSKSANVSGFIPFEGDGFALLVPSKWNPSAKQEFEGTAMRYEDNYYPINSLAVLKRPSDKSKISDYGPPEKFLQENASDLLGKQVFSGDSQEGGFKRGKVASVNILDAETAKDTNGKEYYKLHTITRTADGTEGGTHQLLAATVDKNKNLYVLKVNVGDKRWYTGAKKYAEGAWNSFIVA